MAKQKKAIIKAEKKELVIPGKTQLNLHNPEHVMAFGKVLKSFIEKNGLSVEIQRTKFASADAWKFAAMNFGLTAIPKSPIKITGDSFYVIYKKISFKKNGEWQEMVKAVDTTELMEQVNIEKEDKKFVKFKAVKEIKYVCECDIVSMATGQKIGFGSMVCSNRELSKVSFDEYAIMSMAQTRSISKAVRNLLGFVMKEAGFEMTPAEEVNTEDTTYSEINESSAEKDFEQVKLELQRITEAKALLDYACGLTEYTDKKNKFAIAFRAAVDERGLKIMNGNMDKWKNYKISYNGRKNTTNKD